MYRYNITLDSNLVIYRSRYNVGHTNIWSVVHGRLSNAISTPAAKIDTAVGQAANSGAPRYSAHDASEAITHKRAVFSAWCDIPVTWRTATFSERPLTSPRAF